MISFAPAPATAACADTVTRTAADTLHLDAVEVVAVRALKSVTSSTPLQSIDAEHIRTAGITDIADAMRRMPGVNLRDYGGAGGLKTVSVRGLGSEHTAVVYDGVALSDCQAGQIDLSRFSLDNVNSLALFPTDNSDIFIPARAAASASSLYISSFATVAPGDSALHLNARMRAGSFGFYNPFMRVSKSNGHGTDLSVNAEYIHADNDYPFTLVNGSYTTRERRQNSRMNSWHGEANVRHTYAGGLTLDAKAYYFDNTRALPGPVVYYVSRTDEHLRERNFFGQTRLKGRIADNLALSATAKFNWATSRYKDYDGKYPGGVLDNYYIQREVYATGALLYTPLPGLALDYSADWAWNNLTSNTRDAIRPYRNSILQTVAGRYTWGRLNAMVRMLYSIYLNDAKDGDAGKDRKRLSPMASVSYRPLADADLYIRASYKNIFRMPTFNEAYFDNYGSINLDPEVTDQYNIGLTYQAEPASWLPDLTVTLDGYLNHVENKIVAIPYNLFIWSMTNLGRVRVYGADATVNAVFRLAAAQKLALSASYSYQRAQPRTDPTSSEWMKQVAYIPLNSGSASLAWQNPWVNVTISATAMSARYTTNSNIPSTRVPGFFEAGATLSRKFTFSKYSLELRADMLNMFDKQYDIVARYPMPGRSWKASVELDF